MGLGQLYLIVFNFALAAGWAAVLVPLLTALFAPDESPNCIGFLPFGITLEAFPFLQFAGQTPRLCTSGDLYAAVEWPLKIFQTAAVLEVIHSMIGLVRAPVGTTFMQVLSRQALLWGIIIPFEHTHTNPRFATLMFAWSLTEVIRYSFYGFKLVLPSIVESGPLVWLRYSTFWILYPLGVGSEMALVYSSLESLRALGEGYRTTFIWIMLLYIPGFPILFMHMISQRKKILNPRPKRKESGIVFPPGRKGDRSTTELGKEAFAAAIGAVDDKAALAVKKEKNWRYGYAKHIVSQVEFCAQSKENCVKIAEAGLSYLREHFELIRDDKTMKFSDALTSIQGSFETGVLKGSKPKPSSFSCTVPYAKGYSLMKPCVTEIEGEQLLAQLEEWSNAGVIEPSCRDALKAVVQNQNSWCDLSGQNIALLGATSAMGPITTLLRCGATVFAVDIDRPGVWEKLFALTKDSCGTLIYPLKQPAAECANEAALAASAGCNMLEQPAEITNWLAAAAKEHCQGEALTIGMYGYLDSALHVKLSMSADAIMEGVSKAYSGAVNLAWLCTPTDAFTIPIEAYYAQASQFKASGLGASLVRPLGMLTTATRPSSVKNTDGMDFAVIDGIVGAQGPNYALSKRMQAWRAFTAYANGQTVSINVAPSTATASVVSNASFAAAFEGMGKFAPMEILREETSRAVMAALLIHDLRNPDATANPKNKLPGSNPIHLMMSGAFHGGIWRMAYKFDTIGTIAAGGVYLKWYLPHLLATGAAYHYGFEACAAFVVGHASTAMEAFSRGS